MASALDRSAVEQAAAVRAGEVDAAELIGEAGERAERAQELLGAFAHLDPDRAVNGVRGAADRGAGPSSADGRPLLAGVPYAVKDLALASAGMPFTCGSRIFGDWVPDFDSAAAARPKASGMAVLGTTVSCEFGLYPVTEPIRFGPVRNPWSPEHTPGGSSGGAAATVASGVLAVAGASDAGGSIRIPAACCGLVGLKPSRGRVSLGPLMGEHPFACEGVLSRTVADTAAMLDVLAGPEPGDWNWAPEPERSFADPGGAGPLRIAIVVEPPFEVEEEVDHRHLAAVERIGELLAELGHEVIEEAPFWRNPALTEIFGAVWMVGAAAFAGWGAQVSGLEPGPETLEPATLAFASRAGEMPAAEYGGLINALQTYARSVVAWSAEWDAVLSPTLALRPPAIGLLDGVTDAEEVIARILPFTPFTPLANITGQPAISLPAGIADDRMPLGVMLTGRPLGEHTLLRLAAELEAADAWDREARPPAWEMVSGSAPAVSEGG